MEVRRATADDAFAIERIRVQCWRAAYRHVFPPDSLDAMPVDESRWRPRLESPPHGWTTFVAERDGAVTGFSAVGPSRDEPGIGELYALYVDPVHWSSGAGRVLIEAAEHELAADYGEATLWVLDDNPRACRFYERAGWAPDGQTKAEERFGVRAPEVRYRKVLRT